MRQVVASTIPGVSPLDDNIRVAPDSFMEKHINNKQAVGESGSGCRLRVLHLPAPDLLHGEFPRAQGLPSARRSPRPEELDHIQSLAPDTQLPIVDHVDIARLAVAAFRGPAQDLFSRRAVGVVSDQMYAQEILGLLAGGAGLRAGSIRVYFMRDGDIES